MKTYERVAATGAALLATLALSGCSEDTNRAIIDQISIAQEQQAKEQIEQDGFEKVLIWTEESILDTYMPGVSVTPLITASMALGSCVFYGVEARPVVKNDIVTDITLYTVPVVKTGSGKNERTGMAVEVENAKDLQKHIPGFDCTA